MSMGPTQRLLRRARDWAGDVEELASLQWELFQLELTSVGRGLRTGAACMIVSVGCAAVGVPLTIVAALIMLADALDWPAANVLTAAGALLIVLAATLAFVGARYCSVETWFPRSRMQAKQNIRTVLSQVSSADRDEEELAEAYYPD